MSLAEDWVRRLGLQPHPEGGAYREIYRSGETVARAALPARFGGDRPLATSIYFLLAPGQVSRFHRLLSDEIWHLYEGGPAILHVLEPGRGYHRLDLGRDAASGQAHQQILRAGWWFGAELAPGASFVLVGCTLSPGFVFEDFELGRKADLNAAFPGHEDLVDRLAVDEGREIGP